MGIGRLEAHHRRVNRRWYRDTIRVERNDGTVWNPLPDVKGSVQYRYAFGSSSNPDLVNESDAETAVLFCDPTADIRTADRVTIVRTGTVWSVTAVSNDRTSAGAMPVTLTSAEVAVPGERLVFTRHLGGGTFTQVASIVVQVAENPTDHRTGDTAQGGTLTGTMWSKDPDATLVTSGDYFTRNGATGQVLGVEHDAVTGRVDLAYSLEVA